MSRLCGGAHEIWHIKVPLFLHGFWVVVGLVGGDVHGVLVRDVVGGGMGDGVLSGW